MKKILVADDSKDLCDVICMILKRHDFDPIPTHDGAEALKILEKTQDISLIITDIIMPSVDGLDIIDHVHDNMPDMPVIAISGGGVMVSSKSIRETLESKVVAYLEKPVCFDTLISTVDANT